MTILIGAIACAGCVTERVAPSRGVVVQPRAPGAGGGEASAGGAGVSMQPAAGATTTGALTVAIKPLGAVAYDGQTLPVVSPSGSFVAVQSGTPQGWKAALGLEPMSGGQSVEVYRATDGVLARQPWPGADGAPARLDGVMLGRAATNEGVLIEREENDGSRQIALVRFETGEARPLTSGAHVHAQGVLLRDGTLLACRRGMDSEAFELVQVDATGEARAIALPEGRPLLPMLAPSQRHAGVMLVHARGLDVALLSRDATGAWAFRARVALSASADALAAFQAVAGAEAAPALSVDASSPLADSIVLLHPVQQRAALVHAPSGRMTLLPSGTHAASIVSGAGSAGLALADARALAFAPWGAPTGIAPLGQLGARVTIMSGQFVARVLDGADGDVLLVGPSAGSGARVQFQLIRARIVAPRR